jgi:hypothetical protein
LRSKLVTLMTKFKTGSELLFIIFSRWVDTLCAQIIMAEHSYEIIMLILSVVVLMLSVF